MLLPSMTSATTEKSVFKAHSEARTARARSQSVEAAPADASAMSVLVVTERARHDESYSFTDSRKHFETQGY